MSVSLSSSLLFTGSLTLLSDNIQASQGATGSLFGTSSFAVSASWAPSTGGPTIKAGSVDSSSFNFSGWAAGGALIKENFALAGAGTQNAGLAFGGAEPFDSLACTEEYNGTSWSIGGALITKRYYIAGAGTQNEALAFGGYRYSPFGAFSCTEEYNGSSWTAGGNLITDRGELSGAGTQNAALAFGGFSPAPGTENTCTEEYDGSVWSAGGDLIIGRFTAGAAGTQNAGLAFGSGPSVISCTEEYDGSTWASGGTLNIARGALGGAGTQNQALAFGGTPGGGPTPASLNCASTEEYNGTTWTVANPLITARRTLAGAGTQLSALAFGGQTPTILTCTEEYTGASGGKKVSVSFSSSFSNNNYSVGITGEDARLWTIESKTANGFTVNSNSSQSISGSTYWDAYSY